MILIHKLLELGRRRIDSLLCRSMGVSEVEIGTSARPIEASDSWIDRFIK